MDYDKIVQGRRRNWDALKPGEVRRQEKEAEKERRREEQEKAGKGRYLSRSEAWRQQQEEKAARDREEFHKAKRQGMILLGALVAAFAAMIVIQQAVSWLQARAWNSRVQEYSRELAEGRVVKNVNDPVGAFATWRGAWLSGDMRTVADMFSPRLLKTSWESSDRAIIARDQQTLHDKGSLQSQVDFAAAFDYPEVVRIPSRPWGNEELAIFRSLPVVRIGDPPDGVRFVVAFSYNTVTGRWYYADGREAQYFNINWKTEAQIPPLQAGPNARRYELDGTEIK